MINHTTINVRNDRLERLRKLCNTEHEHFDGMNECPICDKDLIESACEELEKLKARITKLEDYLDHTVDGMLVDECEKLYCPECGEEVRVGFDICYCDECGNPDSYGEPPLPLLPISCFANPKNIPSKDL